MHGILTKSCPKVEDIIHDDNVILYALISYYSLLELDIVQSFVLITQFLVFDIRFRFQIYSIHVILANQIHLQFYNMINLTFYDSKKKI